MPGSESKSRPMSIQRDAPSQTPTRGRAIVGVRRAAFVYFVAWIVGAQITFALLQLGASLPERRVMLSVLFAAWPLAAIVPVFSRSSRRPPGDDARGLLLWTALGLGAYVYWAASYYFVAWAVDPARARLLSDAIEAQIPLAPAWSLVYIGVHPFSVTPCLGIRSARLLRRHVVGQAAIVAISSAAWAAFPVAFRRIEMPADPPDFGAWVLASIYGRDPIVNCLPSTHCAMAIYTASALSRVDARLGAWAFTTAAAIGASTLFTKEHYVVDVIAGFLLGGAAAVIAHRTDGRGTMTNKASTTPR